MFGSNNRWAQPLWRLRRTVFCIFVVGLGIVNIFYASTATITIESPTALPVVTSSFSESATPADSSASILIENSLPPLADVKTLQQLAYTEKNKYQSNKGDFRGMGRLSKIFHSLGYCSSDSVILVGRTNAGQSSVQILRACPNVTFYGFEIQQLFFQKAKAALKPYEHAKVLNMGWSDAVKNNVPIGGSGGRAGLYDPKGQRGWKLSGESISTIPLSVWAATNLRGEKSSILYLIVDTEGHEPRVIRGMDLVKPENQQRFPMFQYELGGTWAKDDNRHGGPDEWTQQQAAQHLNDVDYLLFLIGINDWLRVGPDFFVEEDNVAMTVQKFGPFIQGNLLAVHKRFAPPDILSRILEQSRKVVASQV